MGVQVYHSFIHSLPGHLFVQTEELVDGEVVAHHLLHQLRLRWRRWGLQDFVVLCVKEKKCLV